jgi:hypothetical protein
VNHIASKGCYVLIGVGLEEFLLRVIEIADLILSIFWQNSRPIPILGWTAFRTGVDQFPCDLPDGGQSNTPVHPMSDDNTVATDVSVVDYKPTLNLTNTNFAMQG